MICISITGLDGSGKSTLLKRLEDLDSSAINILRVPEIDVNKLSANSELYHTAFFIKKLNKQADDQNFPQLKLIALFFSFLLFKDILDELKKAQPSVIYCERHPLIDTMVYGYFYAGMLMPDTFPIEIAAKIELENSKELDFLIGKLNLIETDKRTSKLISLLTFLYRQFVLENRLEFSALKKMFGIEMPDKIVYLKAEAEILMERLSDRKHKEPHESKAVFEKLLPRYDQILQESKVKTITVDANNFKNLDLIFGELKRGH